MSYTLESIGAGHAYSLHPYVQWIIRQPNGFTVDNRAGAVRRFDSEEAAVKELNKLNKRAA